MCVLVRTEEFELRPLAEQDLIEHAVRDVPGVRMIENEEWMSVLDSLPALGSPVVMVLPLSLKGAQKELQRLLGELEKRMPLPQLLAILLLIQNSDKAPIARNETLTMTSWLERIDQFFDNALPVSFIFTSSENPRLVQMNVSAAVSGLWKTLESFRELRALSNEIDKLRVQVDQLERRLK
ncbi:MAG: hypothetical protein EBR09_00775 [Proteobacteria bacterium]|nr:hypothetical protein [Pseudomonadota bacterium]